MADPEKALDANDADVEDLTEEECGADDKATNRILCNREILAALQGKLSVMNLPAPVKRRVKALKKVQFECTNIEAKFFEEVHALECKYHLLYSPFYEKRRQVTSGDYEPKDEECEWPSDDEKDEELSAELKKKINLATDRKDKESENETTNEDKDVKGIPDFWLTIFKNVDMLGDMIEEHDEPILKHLMDITIKFSESNPMGFTLFFHFSPNDFFTNAVLTKEYEMKCVPEESDPFTFEGPEIFKCKGCTIDWKKGKNVTVKTIKKKQKHKSRGSVRTVTKTVQNDSFFNFFNPPSVPDDPEADIDEDAQNILTADFEIGHYIRERIVPRAVLYFTGEALDADDYEEEEEEEEDAEDGEEGEEEEDDDDEVKPSGKSPAIAKGQQNPAECKQQ